MTEFYIKSLTFYAWLLDELCCSGSFPLKVTFWPPSFWKSAKEYLKAMFWCLYLWKVHTSKLIILIYTWCYDGLTVYPWVIQIWKPFWFKEANIFDNNNNKNFHSYNASDIDGVLTIQWIVSTWLSWLCGCIAVYTGALDQMILALGIIQMSNIAQFEERKLLENN